MGIFINIKLCLQSSCNKLKIHNDKMCNYQIKSSKINKEIDNLNMLKFCLQFMLAYLKDNHLNIYTYKKQDMLSSNHMKYKKLKTSNLNTGKNTCYKLYLLEKQNNQKDIKIYNLLFGIVFGSLLHIKYNLTLIINK